ncbi:MAG: hypothetical protein Q9183_000485 [Haloplaca sp. 2 TL-2023]
MRLHHQLPVRLLTHNIRYATNALFPGEREWSVRAPRIISELRLTTAYCDESLICLQEVLHRQLLDVLEGLNSDAKGEWNYIGAGRDDGKHAGEYCPIFYRPSAWALQSWETVWLSETPDKPSKGWDAASIRILTLARFQHRASKRNVVAMNTHLDDQGVKSRFEAVKIILSKIDEESHQGSLPLVLAGDFNSQQDEDAYQTLTHGQSPMSDVQGLAAGQDSYVYGHHDTYTGFTKDDESMRIDFLFLNQKSYPWLVRGYGVLENRFDDEIYNSDHCAVLADVLI